MKWRHHFLSGILVGSIGATSCVGTIGDSGDATHADASATSGAPPDAATEASAPFESVPPAVYVNKVKNLLIGAPPTPAEIAAVEKDPATLKTLITAWLNDPVAQTTLTAFFTTAFQQKNLSPGSFSDQLNGLRGGWYILFHENQFIGRYCENTCDDAWYTEAFQESFGRTVWQLTMVEGLPFTQVLTTRRFMLTPALMSAYLFFDRYRPSLPSQKGNYDIGGYGTGYADIFANSYPDEVFNMWMVKDGSPFPIEDTLNPQSSNYLHWYAPPPAGYKFQGQPLDPPTYTWPILMAGTDHIFLLLNGLLYSESPKFIATTIGSDNQMPPGPKGAQWTQPDFQSWRMVTIRQPDAAEKPIRFWDIPTLRTTTELALASQRVGFFTTPAFFGDWNTNQSNQFRVTANQTLIVALGESLLDSNVIVKTGAAGTTDENASDAAHLANPACTSCHATLDPLRRFFSQTYQYTANVQTDATLSAQNGTYFVNGANESGASLYDLGNILASDPAFPPAWVNKLCQWANSASCDTTDPEFLRIAAAFKANNFNLRSLLVDLLSSPLITGASSTQTWTGGGEPISIARYDHLCTSLSRRLAVNDVCDVTKIASQNASNIPADNYVRGSSTPYLPAQPSLFFRTAIENLCSEIANAVVDGTAANGADPTVYRSTTTDTVQAAIQDMASRIMSLSPDDPRYAPSVAALQQHYADALQTSGITPTSALRSTFTVACTAPSSVAVGL